MERVQFLCLMDELLELEPGTLKGDEPLEGLENWSSLAIIGFMAIVHEHTGVIVLPRQISSCVTIDDLRALAGSDSA
jgi:acyl carrier protein